MAIDLGSLLVMGLKLLRALHHEPKTAVVMNQVYLLLVR